MPTQDLKMTIAANVTDLRKKHQMTQVELAEHLNYTDKAVSKWERGESLPDITVLKKIADLFSVSVDYLLKDEHESDKQKSHEYNAQQRRNHRIIAAMSSMLVWLIATFTFVNIDLISHSFHNHWLIFVYAVPVTLIVLLVLNCVWGRRKLTFALVSLLVWSILASIYLSLLSYNLLLIFAIGVPAQVIIILWSGLRVKTHFHKPNA